MRIKKGDKVIITAGADKGKAGVVMTTNPKNNTITVEKINVRVHHIKPTQQNPTGSIEKREGPIHVSNVILAVGKGKKSVDLEAHKFRMEYREKQNGTKEKVRISKKNGVRL